MCFHIFGPFLNFCCWFCFLGCCFFVSTCIYNAGCLLYEAVKSHSCDWEERSSQSFWLAALKTSMWEKSRSQGKTVVSRFFHFQITSTHLSNRDTVTLITCPLLLHSWVFSFLKHCITAVLYCVLGCEQCWPGWWTIYKKKHTFHNRYRIWTFSIIAWKHKPIS